MPASEIDDIFSGKLPRKAVEEPESKKTKKRKVETVTPEASSSAIGTTSTSIKKKKRRKKSGDVRVACNEVGVDVVKDEGEITKARKVVMVLDPSSKLAKPSTEVRKGSRKPKNDPSTKETKKNDLERFVDSRGTSNRMSNHTISRRHSYCCIQVGKRRKVSRYLRSLSFGWMMKEEVRHPITLPFRNINTVATQTDTPLCPFDCQCCEYYLLSAV